MKRFWSDPAVVGKTPILTTFLLEFANVGQLVRMWSERSALGQAWQSWLSVGLALLLWINFYRVVCPEQRFARYCTMFGLAMNGCVVLTVIWFRYLCSGAPR